jgi:hypothetical protein
MHRWSADLNILGITALSAVVLLLVNSVYLSEGSVVKIKVKVFLSVTDGTAAVILKFST